MSKNCALCNQYLIEPVQTDCGHNICKVCIHTNLDIIKKIKNGDELGNCVHCQGKLELLGGPENVNLQFDQLLQEYNQQMYLERVQFHDNAKLIPTVLMNFPKSRMSKKLLVTLTDLFQNKFDKKRVYFVDQIVTMLTEMVVPNRYVDLHIMVKFFILMLLSLESNPLQRMDIKCFSINGAGIKKPIWCMFHKDMWNTYLSTAGDNTFDTLDAQFITLINIIISDKICPDPSQKTAIAKKMLETAVANGRTPNPWNAAENEPKMVHFLNTNIDLVSTDPDFRC